ncbi:MAG: hypothetical protein V4751_06190 [Pseudomonadota bacterium]
MTTQPCRQNEFFTEEVDWPDVQALVRFGFAQQPASMVLWVTFTDATTSDSCRRWLAQQIAAVTPAVKSAVDAEQVLLNMAFSPAGLAKFGLPAASLNTFPMEFSEGMHSQRGMNIFRGDPLADHNENHDATMPGRDDSAHLVLLLYARQPASLQDYAAALEHSLQGLATLAVQATELTEHEHFGYRDGLSNPVIRGARPTIKPDAVEPGGLLAPGEFLFGYADERGLLAVSPVVPAASDPLDLLPATVACCSDTGVVEYCKDLGRNGSFLALLQLQQDVEGFRTYVETTATEANVEKLYAQLMGRWRGGAPLTTSPNISGHEGDGSARRGYNNNFEYADTDANGDRCPVGAHIRRSNPRDTLDKDRALSWRFANRHRILRRGRLYGKATDQECGMLFMCLNISPARQFEHIQRTWLDSPRFASHGETDPVVGRRGLGNGEFNGCPVQPSQRLRKLPRFVTLRAGGYFFLPSLRALRMLASAQP